MPPNENEPVVMKKVGEDFLALITSNLTGLGSDLAVSAEELATYSASRAAHLASIMDEPGFSEAVAAEKDNVALRAGIASVNAASASEARLLGVLEGGLVLGARALSGIPGIIAGLLG